MMSESLMHYVWMHQLHDSLTIGTQAVKVEAQGQRNLSDGPDFALAQLRWQGLLWCGAVEIHLRASDWYRHGHHTDPLYNGVVLHVVLEADELTFDATGREVPTATMSLAPALLEKLNYMDTQHALLRCAPEIALVPPALLTRCLPQWALERIESKVGRIVPEAQAEGDYHTVFYHTLLKYMGAYVNNEAMAQLASALPYLYLRKHSDDTTALEAMLLGQAGLIALDAPRDDYEALLAQEYRYYAHKFDLSPLPLGLFRKLRVRPSSYAPRMLAIAAQLLSREEQLLSALVQGDAVSLGALLRTPPSDYWCTHYDFAHTASRVMGGVGEQTLVSLWINALLPTTYAYHRAVGSSYYEQSLLAQLAALPAEHNHITRLFERQGLCPSSAVESQGLLHLYHTYCEPGRCLLCPVAPAIFRALRSE